jgi:uncharacterized membrane protein YphA (DoxX/SURF4 family)
MSVVVAHATWFTDTHHAFDPGFALQPWSLTAVVVAVATAVLWRRVAGRFPGPELRPLRPLGALGPWIPRILAAHAGVSLLAQAFRGEYLAPSLLLPPTRWGFLLATLEAIVGLWLIVGIKVRPAAWLLVAAGPLGMLGFGVLPVLERLDLLGIAVFLALLPPDDTHPAGRIRIDPAQLRHALFGLRLLVGSALIIVAFTEKLARPALSLGFLDDYPIFNVAQLAGLPVSDELFLQFAGGMEILIGLLLISGALPQLTILIAAVPFNITLFFLGTPELLGHLPIYGVMLALLVYGSRADTSAACSWLPRWRTTEPAEEPAMGQPRIQERHQEAAVSAR